MMAGRRIRLTKEDKRQIAQSLNSGVMKLGVFREANLPDGSRIILPPGTVIQPLPRTPRRVFNISGDALHPMLLMHNLGTQDVAVITQDANGHECYDSTIRVDDKNSVTITFHERYGPVRVVVMEN